MRAPNQRHLEWKAALLSGELAVDIAKRAGVSRQAVVQALNRLGVDVVADRPFTERERDSVLEQQRKDAEREAKRQERCGGLDAQERAEWRKLRLGYAYHNKRANARATATPFSLTKREFMRLWVESGKLDQKGRGIGGYGLCLFDKAVGFVPGNVLIGLCTDAATLAQLRSERHADDMRNIHCTYPGLSKPYLVSHRGRVVGRAASIEEAQRIRAQFQEGT